MKDITDPLSEISMPVPSTTLLFSNLFDQRTGSFRRIVLLLPDPVQWATQSQHFRSNTRSTGTTSLDLDSICTQGGCSSKSNVDVIVFPATSIFPIGRARAQALRNVPCLFLVDMGRRMGWSQKRSRPGRSSAGENEGQPLSLLGVVLLSVARNGPGMGKSSR